MFNFQLQVDKTEHCFGYLRKGNIFRDQPKNVVLKVWSTSPGSLSPSQRVSKVKTVFITILRNYLYLLLCWISIDGTKVMVRETAATLALLVIVFFSTVHSQLLFFEKANFA